MEKHFDAAPPPRRKPRTTITTRHVRLVKELSEKGAFRPTIAAVVGISYSAVRTIQLRERFKFPGILEYLQLHSHPSRQRVK